MKDHSFDLPPCFDCASEAGARLEQMFVETVQKRRIALGQSPALRPVFRKLHGVIAARFVVRPDLPPELGIGVFAGSSYDAWVRFSSDAAPTNHDLETTLGVAIKLFGVPGQKLLGDGDTHDFVLQNHDVFFVDTAKDMCEFTYAGVVAGDYQPYLDANPRTAQILKDMAKVEGSLLTAKYWSVLPFRLGSGYVKYFLRPTIPAENVPDDATNYLATDLRTRLRGGSYQFEFCVQPRTDPQTMPLDAATVRWDSEPTVVGRTATARTSRSTSGTRSRSTSPSAVSPRCAAESMPPAPTRAARPTARPTRSPRPRGHYRSHRPRTPTRASSPP